MRQPRSEAVTSALRLTVRSRRDHAYTGCSCSRFCGLDTVKFKKAFWPCVWILVVVSSRELPGGACGEHFEFFRCQVDNSGFIQMLDVAVLHGFDVRLHPERAAWEA